MNEDKFSGTAQRMILAELNRIDTTRLSVKELIRFYDTTKPTMAKALSELEDAGLITRQFGVGEHRRDKYVRWTLHGRVLWNAARPMMSSPVTMVCYAESVEANPDFVNAGESLLHELLPEYDTRARPCYAYKAASDKNNLSRISKCPMKKSKCRIEFWRFPPIFEGRNSIDNLSLFLALESAHDPKTRDFREKLLDTFPWEG